MFSKPCYCCYYYNIFVVECHFDQHLNISSFYLVVCIHTVLRHAAGEFGNFKIFFQMAESQKLICLTSPQNERNK